MHMADALLSPAVGAAFWAGSLGAVVCCAKKLRESMDDRMIPLMGVLGAFIFSAQMINFTIPATGSSGHLGGGMILAIMLGPYAAFIVMASVLIIQAFFFADGGLLALGCNIWNLGIYPCLIAYPLVYRPLVKHRHGPLGIVTASVISAVAGLQLGAFSVVMQTFLSGRTELPFSTFALVMQPVHLAIGLVEGTATAGVINFVRVARPELLESVSDSRRLSPEISLRRVMTGLLIAAVAIGGALSWFASARPDGLEWSIEKVFGRPELPDTEQGIAPSFRALQEKSALLPEYGFRKSEDAGEGKEHPSWPAGEPGTSVAGIVGAGIVLITVLLVGLMIRLVRRRPS